jgi:hypothetical protein
MVLLPGAAAAEGEVPGPGNSRLQAALAEYDRTIAAKVDPKTVKSRLLLEEKYRTALQRQLDRAVEAGKLEEAVDLKRELERVNDSQPLPEADEGVHEEVRKLRKTYRDQLAEIERERLELTKPIRRVFDRDLEALQRDLTRAGQLEEALKVKMTRDQLFHPDNGYVEEIIRPSAADTKAGEASAKTLFDSLVQRMEISSDSKGVTVMLEGQEAYHDSRHGCHVLSFGSDGLEHSRFFPHVYEDKEKEEQMLHNVRSFISSVPNDRVIAVTVSVAFNPFLGSRVRHVSSELGGVVRDMRYLQPYICVGFKGLGRGQAIEVLGEPVKGDPARFDSAKLMPQRSS